MAYCVKCGKELRSGDRFCFYCGAKAPSLESETEDISRENQGSDEISRLAEQPISNYTGNTQNDTAAAVIRSEGLSLMQYFCKCYSHYADFSGKANRKELWGFYLVYYLIVWALILAGVLITSVADASLGMILYVLAALYSSASIIPSLSVTVRRLHDIGKSGWWIFISLIPFIGSIWLLVLLCTKGSKETNDQPASSAFKSQTIICIALYIVLIIAGVLVYDYYDNLSMRSDVVSVYNKEAKTSSDTGNNDSNKHYSRKKEGHAPRFVYLITKTDSNYNQYMQIVDKIMQEYSDEVDFNIIDIDKDKSAKQNFASMIEMGTPVLIMIDAKDNISGISVHCDNEEQMRETVEKAFNYE